MPMSSVLPKISLPSDSIFAEAEFSRGFVRDEPRSSIPTGGVFDIQDFLVDMPGMLWKRGGWRYQSSTCGSNVGGFHFVSAPEFPTGLRVVALAADGHLYDVTTATATSFADLGPTWMGVIDNPALYVDKLVVPFSDGVRPPVKITAPASSACVAVNWGGSPPPGRHCTVHLSRVILANSVAFPNRLWFSPVPDPEATWDVAPTTGKAYWDTNHAISGLASCQGVLLVFSEGHTERLVGDIIPGQVGENMSLQSVGEVGCVDARSIVPWRGNVIFAGQAGIWVTNGVGFDSLIQKDDGSGIQSYWREIYDEAFSSPTAGAVFAAGLYGADHLYVSVTGAGTVFDTWLCYLPRKAWTRLGNVGVRSFAPAVTGQTELYGGTSEGMPGNRVVRFSTVGTPSASFKDDGNGVAVQPYVLTRMVGDGVGLKAYGHGHITYDLRGVSPNMLPNPGFETNLSGWTAGGVFSVVFTRETPVGPHGGVAVARMVSTDPGVRFMLGTSVPVVGGTLYRAETWGRLVSAATVQSQLFIRWFAGATELTPSSSPIVALTPAWARVGVDGRAPDSADSAQVFVSEHLSLTGGDTTEYDDFYFAPSAWLQIQSSVGIEGGAAGFRNVDEASTVPETVEVTRRRFITNRDGQTLNLLVQQHGASVETQIYAVEQEARQYNAPADGN